MDKPNPSPQIKMHAYVIMLHLRSQVGQILQRYENY